MSNETLHQELEELLLELAKTKTADMPQRIQMYRIYNKLFAVKERNTTCGACVSRVYNNLLKYYNEKVLNTSVTRIDPDNVEVSIEEAKAKDPAEKKTRRRRKKDD